VSHHVPRSRLHRRPLVTIAASALAVAMLTAGTAMAAERLPGPGSVVDGQVWPASTAAAGFLVQFHQTADLSGTRTRPDRDGRARYVYERSTEVATASQAGLRAELDARGIRYSPFWAVNALLVEGDHALAAELAARPEVARVVADGPVQLPESAAQHTAGAVEWNVADVGAPGVWDEFDVQGEGIVVAVIATGAQYDHPALVRQYRGNQGGGVFDHNYNWIDVDGVCPTSEPCDDHFLGTHNLGVMVGDGGPGNEIGVAPGAQWIAAKPCDFDMCKISSILAAMQWMLAPTDLAGQNPDPSKAPHVINNPWGVAPGAGGLFVPLINAWLAAGIFPVFAVGSFGPDCGTVLSPADYVGAYAVGAHDINHHIATTSGRGDSQLDGSVKPNITAPGVDIRSSVPGSGYAQASGTGFASPHVAGAVALIWSTEPALTGDIRATRRLLDVTATSVSDLTCGGMPANNNVWGQGRVNAFHAVSIASAP
jgi:subtilisin family serine protease